MNARTPTDFQFSFKGFTERGGATDIHADGWGLATYAGRGIQAFHEKQPSCSSPIANLLSSSTDPIKTHNVLAHIRYATVGATALENVHPFTRELWGRNWAFAHNGDLPHFSNVTLNPSSRFQAVGTTDSEAVFTHILNRLNDHFDTTNGAPSSCELFNFLKMLASEIIEEGRQFAVENNPENPNDYQPIFNFLMTCGEGLQFAFCYPGKRPNSECWNSLHYITRRAPFKKARLVDNPEIEVDFAAVTDPNDVVSVIATQPLTAEDDWIEMKKEELLMFEYGQPFGTPNCEEAEEASDSITNIKSLEKLTPNVEFDSPDMLALETLTQSNPHNNNFGKGDDTIKEINKFSSITIDPHLTSDPSFWDYCLIPSDQGGLTLNVLGPPNEFASDLLVGGGANLDDVEYYGIFSTMGSASPAPNQVSNSALIISSSNLNSVDRSKYSKIVSVLSAEESTMSQTYANTEVDIKVSSLGELRALSICSYALLNKKS
ncbi:hypothetical protein TrST_g13556 [Triparma strigata]|uniref:Glutamine amidotransferase type-2 domain-containing protein n=1 Tax=Triparma strigata TaxID=1606541 RepID=A0A9W7DS54_9STRA|nr:hypothetical protein TrST_g13556 [Triparma strigata]